MAYCNTHWSACICASYGMIVSNMNSLMSSFNKYLWYALIISQPNWSIRWGWEIFPEYFWYLDFLNIERTWLNGILWLICRYNRKRYKTPANGEVSRNMRLGPKNFKFISSKRNIDDQILGETSPNNLNKYRPWAVSFWSDPFDYK